MTETGYFQDYYPDELSHCYGCGRLNEHGLQIKSAWDGEETVAYFTPRPYHTAIPGYVYGGLLASLIDCHGTGTASAAATEPRGDRWAVILRCGSSRGRCRSTIYVRHRSAAYSRCAVGSKR